MENEQRKLKIGDVVYIFDVSKITRRIIISKITKTMAISNDTNYRFRLSIDYSGYLHIIGVSGGYSSTTAQLANNKLDQAWEDQKIINWFNNVHEKFTLDQKKIIYQLFMRKIT